MTEITRHATVSGASEFEVAARSGEQSGLVLRRVLAVLGAGAIYYLATRVAWVLCFPDSKVSLFFPPHAILVAILLLAPTRHWWAYVLAAACSHFFATQQEHWPPLYALQCEAFDATSIVLTAAGIRLFVKSPLHLFTLRDAILFVLIAAIIVPFGVAFWGAAFTVAYGFGASYWIEWRNLGISNAVTTIVLAPVILIGVHQFTRRVKVAPAHFLEASLLVLGVFAVGYVTFDRLPAGPDTSPALLYAPIPLLVWAALRTGLGGISACVLAITMLAIWGTMQGRGPFLTQTAEENALALQMFILVAAVPLQLLAVAIEDERRSKDALRVSEERMGMAAESAQMALWEWDVANDKVWMSDEGRKFLGFEPDAPLQLSNLVSVDGRVHPDDREIRAVAIREALKPGGSYDVEYRVSLPDGSVRWIASRGRQSPLGTDARPRILGVSMDVTLQKQARAEALLQREELAHLSRATSLTALSGSLAHELNQPLTSILGNTHAGLSFLSQGPPDPVELRAILEDIDSAATRAGEIIERMRTLLRRGEVAIQPVYVSESLEELLRLTRTDLIARGVSVINLASGELPPVLADRVQLQQVLLNLIKNACDAMESTPPEHRKVTLTTFVQRDEFHIGVLDCGVGLPENIESMFEPFHSTKTGGMGMGFRSAAHW